MAHEKQDPIQEQLTQARRNQILDAATTVFAEKGFQRATIRDVAKAAGIADGTIYIYFENKAALLFSILDRLNETERKGNDLAQAGEMDLHEFFRMYFRRRSERLAEEGLEVFRALLPEVLVNPELRQQYVQQSIEPSYALAEEHLIRLVEQGKLRPLDVPLASRVISATIFGLVMLWIMGDPVVQSQWDEVPDLLTTMLLDGIVSDAGGNS